MKELEDLRLLVMASAKELDAAARHGLKSGYLNEGETQATLKLAADLAMAFRALDARLKVQGAPRQNPDNPAQAQGEPLTP